MDKFKSIVQKNIGLINEADTSEFPLFLLSTRTKCDRIFYEDAITINKGKPDEQAIRRTCEVTWAPSDSSKAPVPPTPFVFHVFLALLRQIALNNFDDPIASFNTKNELLSILYPGRGGRFGKKDYEALDNALFCLQNMHIKTTGSYVRDLKPVGAEYEYNLFSATQKNINGRGEIALMLNIITYNHIHLGRYFWLLGDFQKLINLKPVVLRYLTIISKKANYDKFEFLNRPLYEFAKLLPVYDHKSRYELNHDDLYQVEKMISKAHDKLICLNLIPADTILEFYTNKNGVRMIKLPNLPAMQMAYQTSLPLTYKSGNPNGLTYEEASELVDKIVKETKDPSSKGQWINIATRLPKNYVEAGLKDLQAEKRKGTNIPWGQLFLGYMQGDADRLGVDISKNHTAEESYDIHNNSDPLYGEKGLYEIETVKHVYSEDYHKFTPPVALLPIAPQVPVKTPEELKREFFNTLSTDEQDNLIRRLLKKFPPFKDGSYGKQIDGVLTNFIKIDSSTNDIKIEDV